MNTGAAQGFFVAGTITFMLAGALHASYALLDTVRPRVFAPMERSVRPAMEASGVRLVGHATPSMWSVWLGIHISHGLGVFTFGLLCLLIATHDFALVEGIGALRPLTIAFSLAYLALSLRFWFRGPVVITATATVCFTVATVLSA